MMHHKKHIWNIGFLTTSSAFARGFFFLTTILVYKAMSLPEAGHFGFLYAVTTTAALLTELGLRGYMVREISRQRESIDAANHLYSTAMTTRLFSFPLQVLIVVVTIWVSGYRGVAWAAALLCISAWSESTSLLVKSAFRAHERMGWEAFTSIFFKFVLAAGVGILAYTHQLTLNAIALIMAGCSATELILVLIVAEISFVFRFRPFPSDFKAMAGIMRASAFFAVLSFVGILYFRMGVLVLGMSGSDSAHSVAVYSLAGRVPEGLSFFPVAIVNALVPFLSRKSEDREAIASTFNSLVKMIGLSSLAAASVLVLCAHEVILVVGKHEYLPYIRVFQLYAFAVITSFLQYVLANQLICINREKQVARRYTICLALNVVLCLILGLKFGAIGAITALLICEAVGLTLDGMLLKKLGQSIRLRSLISWGAMLICVGVAYGISLYFDRYYRLPIIALSAGLVLIFTAFREIRELARNVQTADTRQVIE